MIYRVWNGKEYLHYKNCVLVGSGDLFFSKNHLDNYYNCDSLLKIEWGFTFKGVDYFEGDIVEVNVQGEMLLSRIVFDEFNGFDFDDKLSPDVHFKHWLEKGWLKVIGNINENPELLEVKDD